MAQYLYFGTPFDTQSYTLWVLTGICPLICGQWNNTTQKPEQKGDRVVPKTHTDCRKMGTTLSLVGKKFLY